MNPPRPRFPQAYCAGLLLAAGLFAAAAHADERPQALTIGTPVRGEITSAERLNYSDGTRSKLYRFNGKAGEVLSFQVSGALRAQLAVYADGHALAQSKTGGRGDSEAATLAYRVESDQAYVLAVSGIDYQAYGPFQLASERLELYGGGPLIPDVTISDLLDGTAREIPLMIETAGLYQIDQRSDAFDTKLELSGNGVSQSDDDGGDGTNSRLLVQLQPGHYTLRAKGYGDSARGLYTLSVVAWNPPEGVELRSGGALPLNGDELTGLLSGENHYFLDVSSRQLVTIDLKSDMFDPYLVLSGVGVDEENDDGGDGLNARIRKILEPGMYQITVKRASAGSRSRSGAGLFRLSASARAIPEGAGTGAALVPGQEIEATLLDGLPNRHAFSVRERGSWRIDMRSDELDSHLRLYLGSELIDSDDDGGSGLNARIQSRLEPGDYIIEASDYEGKSGDYQLVVRRQ